jgi:hypothetical protein
MIVYSVKLWRVYRRRARSVSPAIEGRIPDLFDSQSDRRHAEREPRFLFAGLNRENATMRFSDLVCDVEP